VIVEREQPAGARLLQVPGKLPSGIKVWATRAPNGAIHVVVINKRLSGAQTVALRIAGAGGTASVEQLLAPNVHATSGVTLGGQTFGSVTSTGTSSARNASRSCSIKASSRSFGSSMSSISAQVGALSLQFGAELL